MTPDDIIRMAREADLWMTSDERIAAVERFAALVRNHLLSTEIHSCHDNCQRFACVQTRQAVEAEREACAKVADSQDGDDEGDVPDCNWSRCARHIAAAIRARSNV
jgi:hypothetical protein